MAKTSSKAKNEWVSRNYDQFLLTLRKGEKEILKKAATAEGVSVNKFIINTVNKSYPGLLSVLDDESKKKKAEE